MSKIEEIIEKWDLGVKQIDIAKDVNVSRSYISQVIKAEKIRRENQKKKKSSSVDSTITSTFVSRNEKKKEIIEMILAINTGHKKYEKFGFKDNHEFLSAIINKIHEL